MKSFPPTLSFSFTLSESHSLDRALADLSQAQSFSFWLLSAFFLFLDQEDFTPTNQSLYLQFRSVLSSVMKNQNEWVVSVQAFLTLLRRKSMLNRLFPSVLNHQREKLLRSEIFQEYLFDEEVLERVISEHSKSQMDTSHVQVAKVLTSHVATALSKAVSSSSFSGRGSRRPFSHPFFSTRGRGGRGGRGRGRSGFKPNANKGKKSNNAGQGKNV